MDNEMKGAYPSERWKDGGGGDSLSPEWRLVLLLARFSVEKSSIDDILKTAAPDWQQVFEISLAHRVFPIVYKNIKNICPELITASLLEHQKKQMLKLAARNLLMTAGLVELIELLAGSDIPVVAFKGPVLAQLLYGDVVYRCFGDLDLLIHPEDLPRTVRLLEKSGFTATFHLSDAQLGKLVRTEKEYILNHDKTGLMLDLQWELTGGYFSSALTLKELLPECKILSIDGGQIPVFGKEDLFVYLCIHGNMHVWEHLDHVCCVAELINKEKLCWEKVFGRSRNIGCIRMLKIGILLASQFMDARVPTQVMEICCDDPLALRLSEKFGKVYGYSNSENRGQRIISRRFLLYHLLSMDSKSAAMRYSFHLLFSPTRQDWLAFPLPSLFWFLLFIIRPFRLVYLFGQRFFARLR